MTQQKPKQDPKEIGPGRQANEQPGRGQQQQPDNPGRRDPSQPGGTPGTKPDPYQHPGDEPDVQPDVIAGRKQQGGPGATNPSASEKPRYENDRGNRAGGQDRK